MLLPTMQATPFRRSVQAALLVLPLLLLLALPRPVSAQSPVIPPSPGGAAVSGAPDSDGQMVDIQADRFSMDSVRHLVLARGHVKVSRGTDWVTADEADVDTARQVVTARGNIELHYGGNVWKGENVTYDFKTGLGDFGAFELYSAPIHITAGDSRRVSPSVTELTDVMLTTCEVDNPEYSVRASSASLESNRIVRARNVRFQLGPVPFFWFPYVRADVNDFANFEFTPGYSSRMGAFLLTTYNYPLSDTFASHTHFDLRSKRGVGVGEDITWTDPASTFDGGLRLYYAHDNRPWHDDAEKARRENLADAERYRINLTDRRSVTDRDTLITTVNYLSDPWVLHDFFDDEYQHGVQPENRLSLSHRGDRYIAGVQLNLRLNDFYDNVNRLPEVFLNFNRQRIFDTPFYYEGENSASYLDRVYGDDHNSATDERDDYDAFRVDSHHMIYLPARLAFLSLVPRAGFRGTYYSKTKIVTTVTNKVAQVDEASGLTNVVDQVQTLLDDGDADFRALPELGFETSFKAFGDLHRGPIGIQEDHDLRHVLEPYARYTYRPEPDLTPDEIWQFDKIDKYTGVNTLDLGLRNYLQTKSSAAPSASIRNLVYANTYLTFDFDPEEDEETLRAFTFDLELRPLSWIFLEAEGVYDNNLGEIDSFNARARTRVTDLVSFAAEYRYRYETRQQVAADLTLFPEMRWQARTYARVDIEESHLDEHSYYLIHRTQCLGIGLGLRIRPDYGADGKDDYAIWLRIWPLAFPSLMGSMPN